MLSLPIVVERGTMDERRARYAAWCLARLRAIGRVGSARLALIAALVLVSPTLLAGLAFDDYLFVYQCEREQPDEWAGSAPLDLFRWVDAAHTRGLVDGQGLAWWSYQQTKVAFMRPLSSLTHALDHWLWPHNAFAMHAQSMLWFALLLLLAARAYSELGLQRSVVALASAMFALDSAHGVAVGWISNRNALVGGVFGIAAVLLHHRRRSGAGRAVLASAVAAFALGLLSTEAALGTAGYLAAYALYYERGPARARCASLLPYAGVAAGWFALRRAAHYGVVGLGGYLDPIQEPLAFLRILPQRALVLLASQSVRLGADLFDWTPRGAQPWLLALAAAGCAGVVWLVWPGLRADRRLRFWACGALLSALPLTAAVPSDRLLTLVGFGVMPTLAAAMRGAAQRRPQAASPGHVGEHRLRRRVALGLAFIHLALDPLLLPLVALFPSTLAAATRTIDASLPDRSALSRQTVIVASIPDSWLLSYLPVMRSVDHRARPEKLHWLLATQEHARFERTGPNRLRVSSAHGFFDERWFERNAEQPLHAGERVQLSEMSVTVVEVTKDGRPLVCDFTFSRPLESPSYLWLTWQAGRLVPFAVPQQTSPASRRRDDA